MSNKTFGEKLKELRENTKPKLTQEELGAKCIPPISGVYISQIEKGKRPAPSEEVIRSLAEALKCDPKNLLYTAKKEREKKTNDDMVFYRQFKKLPPDDRQKVISEVIESLKKLKTNDE